MSCSGHCQQVNDSLQDIKTTLEKMDKAVFTGNGTPGLLSRVASLETAAKVIYALLGLEIAAIAAWASMGHH